jgi:hypothetical protein
MCSKGRIRGTPITLIIAVLKTEQGATQPSGQRSPDPAGELGAVEERCGSFHRREIAGSICSSLSQSSAPCSLGAAMYRCSLRLHTLLCKISWMPWHLQGPLLRQVV